MWNWFSRQRGFHIINLTFGLAWIVHLLACGWYICASVHVQPKDTWVFRRVVGLHPDGHPQLLVDTPPLTQWSHAMYFTLTVFTTVGFGDIFAVTNGEIIYVCFMMLVGAVVHSMIISSVINVVMSSDKVHDFISKNTKLVCAFAQHTELSDGATHEMKSWVTMSAKYWITHQYDKDEMRNLIVGKIMPPHLLAHLPRHVFSGRLFTNGFLNAAHTNMDLPPRLPLLLALMAQKATFGKGDIVYKVEEYAFSMFLVMTGTFAYIAQPVNAAVPGPGWASRALMGRRATDREKHTMAASMSDVSIELKNEVMFCPYRLFSFGSYFGDIEAFTGCWRLATVRCESPGSILLIHTTDLRNLFSEFPQFAVKWRVEARRHEQAKPVALEKLTSAIEYRDLAANQIARAWRRHRHGGVSRGSAPPKNIHGVAEKVRKPAQTASKGVADLSVVNERLVSLASAQERLSTDVQHLAAKVDRILEALSISVALPGHDVVRSVSNSAHL